MYYNILQYYVSKSSNDIEHFKTLKELNEHLENKIQEMISTKIQEGLRIKNVDIRFSTLCEIVRIFANDMETIKKTIKELTEPIYGNIIPEEKGEEEEI
jgi:predicted transcriptional regulator